MATAHKGTPLSSDEALKRLIEGNQRFLRGEARSSAFRRETLTDLAKAQRPYATVLGCSDSRVPPEWIFDTGLGELFVIRVAGNVLSEEIGGTLQYAGSYLETPLFVILGHEGCGAIAGALATKHEGEQFRSWVQLLLARIVPGLPELDPSWTCVGGGFLMRRYTDVVGLKVMAKAEDGAFAVLGGACDVPNLALFRARPGRSAGLHHVGFLAWDEADLDAAPARLKAAGMTHEVELDSEYRRCVHVRDPDGIRLQFYVDRGAGLDALVRQPEELALYLS